MNRYILVTASHRKSECWNQETLGWLRWTSLQILALGYDPLTIFHGVDEVSSATAYLLAGGLSSVQWVLPAPSITGKVSDGWREDLVVALQGTPEDAMDYLQPNLPKSPYTKTPSVFSGVTGIIVVPSGFGSMFRTENGQYTLWSCGAAHIVKVGKPFVEPMSRTIGTM